MASSGSRPELRSREDIYLIGKSCSQIIGNKLPSKQQVLSVLFHNLRHVKLNLKEASRLVVQEVCIFYEKARIPSSDVNNCVKKLLKLYQEWRNLQKDSKKKTENHKSKVKSFQSKLSDLFDIAHKDALKMIDIEEDRNFLILQRQPGRPGYMAGVDSQLRAQEEKTEKRKKTLLKRKLRSDTEMQAVSKYNVMNTLLKILPQIEPSSNFFSYFSCF